MCVQYVRMCVQYVCVYNMYGCVYSMYVSTVCMCVQYVRICVYSMYVCTVRMCVQYVRKCVQYVSTYVRMRVQYVCVYRYHTNIEYIRTYNTVWEGTYTLCIDTDWDSPDSLYFTDYLPGSWCALQNC